MKKIVFALVFFTFISMFFISCNMNDHDISIQVHNNEDKYEFKAYYPENRTWDVQDYFNQQIEPNGLFASSNDYMNVDTKLNDGTHFHVNASAGKIDIVIDKNENSTASVQRIEAIGEGIKKLLTK